MKIGKIPSKYPMLDFKLKSKEEAEKIIYKTKGGCIPLTDGKKVNWMVRFDDGGAYFNTFVYLSEQGGS